MTQESKAFFKKYWQAIAIFLTCNLLIVFFGNIGANKVHQYRVDKLELEFKTFKSDFNSEIKPNIDILSWMHNIGIRGEKLNNDHEHNN